VDKTAKLAPPAAYLDWMLGDYYANNLRRALEFLAKEHGLEFSATVTEFTDYHPL
jgi:hypothetical protein